MKDDIKDKVEWTVIFVLEFLSRFKGIEFIDRHYGYAHTQSFASMVDDVAEYCHRRGGALL